MSDTNLLTGPNSGSIPSRGTILCVFQDAALVQTIEPAIARRGFALLRARSALHGLWIAATAQPDAILTDIPRAGCETDQLLESLNKNRRTRELPVIALVDSVKQTEIRPTCLRMADRCLLKTANVDVILSAVAESIEQSLPAKDAASNRPDRVLRVDAVFSEFGDSAHSSGKFSTVYRQRNHSPVNHRLATPDAELDVSTREHTQIDPCIRVAEKECARPLRNAFAGICRMQFHRELKKN